MTRMTDKTKLLAVVLTTLTAMAASHASASTGNLAGGPGLDAASAAVRADSAAAGPTWQVARKAGGDQGGGGGWWSRRTRT
jgi:hypothetical protein